MLVLSLTAALLASVHFCTCTDGQSLSRKVQAASPEASESSNPSSSNTLRKTPPTKVEVDGNTKVPGAAAQRELLGLVRKTLNRPNMTIQEWQVFRISDPIEAKKIEATYRRRKCYHSQKRRFRLSYRKDPQDRAVFQRAAKKGFTRDDLTRPSRRQDSDRNWREEDKRKIRVYAFIRRVRTEIAQSGKPPREGKEGHRLSKFDRDVDAVTDDPILKALTHFRSVFRADPFDPKLPALSRNLEALIKPTYPYFEPFELPRLPNTSPIAIATWGRKRKRYQRIEKSEATQGNTHGHGIPSITPSAMEELHRQYDTIPKKQAYIESLFDSESLFGRADKRRRVAE